MKGTCVSQIQFYSRHTQYFCVIIGCLLDSTDHDLCCVVSCRLPFRHKELEGEEAMVEPSERSAGPYRSY